MDSETENPAEGLTAGQSVVAKDAEALRSVLEGFFRARNGWHAGVYSAFTSGTMVHGDSAGVPVLICQGRSAAEILSTLRKMPIRWPVLVRPAPAGSATLATLPRERDEWRDTKQSFWSTAARAKRAALERGDRKFLAEAAAFFRSPHDVPASLLPGGGRGRKPDPKLSRRMIGILENAEIKADGRLTNFKGAAVVVGLGRREHGELLRFCIGIFEDVADGIDDVPEVARRCGLELPKGWALLQKALRVGLRYAKPKPGPYTRERIERLLCVRCP